MSKNYFFRKDGFTSELVFEDLDKFKDIDYINFIQTYGDGFYFNYSLHMYGTSNEYQFHDIKFRTEFFHELFSDFIEPETICFGEDLFGHQFIFYSKGCGFFNIETGEISPMGENFNDWLEIVSDSPDYYSGESLLLKWNMNNENIKLNERLTPKIPFVVGGKFEIENLYKNDYRKILGFNADFAKQIRDLPDGATITFKVE